MVLIGVQGYRILKGLPADGMIGIEVDRKLKASVCVPDMLYLLKKKYVEKKEILNYQKDRYYHRKPLPMRKRGRYVKYYLTDKGRKLRDKLPSTCKRFEKIDIQKLKKSKPLNTPSSPHTDGGKGGYITE